MRIYLASPYSHERPEVREQRYRAVCIAAGQLLEAGHFAYSPIAHSHGIAVHGQLSGGFDFWQSFDLDMLENWSEVLIVLMLIGWDQSTGVKAEKQRAQELAMPIVHWALSAPIDSLDLTFLR